jgi:hypothetical protein
MLLPASLCRTSAPCAKRGGLLLSIATLRCIATTSRTKQVIALRGQPAFVLTAQICIISGCRKSLPRAGWAGADQQHENGDVGSVGEAWHLLVGL